MTRIPSPKDVFDAVDGVVGGALERAVQSRPFVVTSRTMLNLEATVRARTERASRHLWHALNLPAGSDVRRLERQLSRLERTIESHVDTEVRPSADGAADQPDAV